MLDLLLKYINPIKIIVLLTLIFGLVSLKSRNAVHTNVKWIIVISCITEYGIFPLLYYNSPISLMYSISFIFHHAAWLFLLSHFLESKERMRLWIVVYLVFGVLNLFLFEGMKNINYYTFIFGAFIYLYFFISESFFQLKKDNFTYFTANSYLLLFSPVLFFLGYSFMFAFQDYNIISTQVLGKIELYDFVGHIVNIMYYVFLNYYIFKERKANE